MKPLPNRMAAQLLLLIAFSVQAFGTSITYHFSGAFDPSQSRLPSSNLLPGDPGYAGDLLALFGPTLTGSVTVDLDTPGLALWNDGLYYSYSALTVATGPSVFSSGSDPGDLASNVWVSDVYLDEAIQAGSGHLNVPNEDGWGLEQYLSALNLACTVTSNALPLSLPDPTTCGQTTYDFLFEDNTGDFVDIDYALDSLSVTLGGSGMTQFDPALPQSTISPGEYSFTGVPSNAWFDPASASAYEYTMTSGSLFDGIDAFPTGFASPFTVSAPGCDIGGTFAGGASLNFVTVCGHGVSDFTVSNIEPGVDPGDSSAFPIQLAFSTPTTDFTAQAFVDTPEPATLTLIILGSLGGLLRVRRRIGRSQAKGLLHMAPRLVVVE